eukprot:Nk52_evm1s676 gene=Nk52_evmTU1s676
MPEKAIVDAQRESNAEDEETNNEEAIAEGESHDDVMERPDESCRDTHRWVAFLRWEWAQVIPNRPPPQSEELNPQPFHNPPRFKFRYTNRSLAVTYTIKERPIPTLYGNPSNPLEGPIVWPTACFGKRAKQRSLGKAWVGGAPYLVFSVLHQERQ